jgi:hypothetical protein
LGNQTKDDKDVKQNSGFNEAHESSRQVVIDMALGNERLILYIHLDLMQDNQSPPMHFLE